MEYPQLQDKVVVVTGASEGLGAALSTAFIEAGCYVWMTARSENKLKRLAAELGERARATYLDVAGPQYCFHELANKITTTDGKLDIWVNNAGVDQKVSLDNLTPALLEKITNTNYYGLVWGTQAAARTMRRLGTQGDIVQILSTSAFTLRADEQAYCASKAAGLSFSESVDLELKQSGIRVIPICPGGMATDFGRKSGLISPKDALNPTDVADFILHTLSLPRNMMVGSRIYRRELYGCGLTA